MRTYELMAVLAPDIAEDEMPGALERISGYITTGGGEVTELITTSPWGRRRLAYEIRDFRDGFYALYHFNLDPNGIGELERDLGLNNQVIRSLVTSYTPPKPKPVAEESGAEMDAEPGEATGPEGEDQTEPPTAETPDVAPDVEDEEEEEESEPARA